MGNWLEQTYDVIKELENLKNKYFKLSNSYFITENNILGERYFNDAKNIEQQIETLRKMTSEKTKKDFNDTQTMSAAMLKLAINKSIKGE